MDMKSWAMIMIQIKISNQVCVEQALLTLFFGPSSSYTEYKLWIKA